MKILVCGGRNFEDTAVLNRVLFPYQYGAQNVIIHGGARGADRLAARWADEHDVETEAYPAYWDKYGKRAGFLRNAQMLKEGKPDIVIAFPGGNGTADMMRRAHSAGVIVLQVCPGAT